MEYRELTPHPALRPFVRALWMLRGAGSDAGPQPILPDGSSELVVHRERPFRRHVAERAAERQPGRLFVGQMRAPVVVEPDGGIDVVGVRFRADGAFALLGCPQDVFTDAIVDVDALGRDWIATATRRAQEAGSAEAALDELQRALRARMDQGRTRSDARVAAVVRLIDRTAGEVSIGAAATYAGTSRRHLERLFVQQTGIGPKVLARLARFQAAAARVVAEPGAALAGVSADGGYFDQSHMIREFLAFAGASPDQLRARLGRMTAWMMGLDRS